MTSDDYHLRTMKYLDVPTSALQSSSLIRKFWAPHPQILDALGRKLDRMGIADRIVDVGAGYCPFPRATHLLDWNHKDVPGSDAGKFVFQSDLDYDRLPYEDRFFSFAYCRHTLEDIQNPLHAFQEIIRVARQGYIETPSPLIELLRGVDGGALATSYRGYVHHRYIVWSDWATNTLYFLPKLPILEHLHIPEMDVARMTYLANHHPVYWNNYYIWDSTRMPRVVVYRNGVNMSITDGDYERLVGRAILESMAYTDAFLAVL
jgi:SAM-dependent methyltransferase